MSDSDHGDTDDGNAGHSDTDHSDTGHSDTTRRLVRMINQIARNVTHEKDPVAVIADHIHAFWTVRMQQQIVAHGAAGLDPVAVAALDRLAPGLPARRD